LDGSAPVHEETRILEAVLTVSRPTALQAVSWSGNPGETWNGGAGRSVQALAVAIERDLEIATDDRRARRLCGERGLAEPCDPLPCSARTLKLRG
jgi:hypothetical protein